jgi:hypothetical protein
MSARTETNPDLIGTANRRLLDASVPTNCCNAQQRHGSQRTPQSVRSQGRCRHEHPAAVFIRLRANS